MADTDDKQQSCSMQPVLSKADLVHLLEISSRMKAIREPVRELSRMATTTSPGAGAGASVDPTSTSAILLGRVREQLDITQRILHEYLVSVPGIEKDHPALTRQHHVHIRIDRPPLGRISSSDASTRTRSRSSTQGSQDSSTFRQMRPTSLFSPIAAVTSPGADQSAAPCSLEVLPETPTANKPSTADAAATEAAVCMHKPMSADATLGSGRAPPPATLRLSSRLCPGERPVIAANAIDDSISRLWRGARLTTAAAKAVNEVSVRLGKRHMTPLEERIPAVPVRELGGSGSSNVPIDVVDLINSLFRSSTNENEASLLARKIETIPPGIVACAIANSSSQLFAQLTPGLVRQYAAPGGQQQQTSADTSAQTVTRMLSDHANFLTRVMETTIIYPLHAPQRARRIEWWVVVACLLRELGDYESLSSLVCVFSGAVVSRLHESWELVSARVKEAIRFMLERVLKIHPNYASYRDELQLRIRRMQRRSRKPISPLLRGDNGDELSLDFDSAIAINTPDLCSADDNYVNSCLFCKEAFDLPPPRALVPIVAVLLKDAVSSEVSENASAPSSRKKRSDSAAATAGALHWTAVIEACQNTALPLALDYYMLRRVFATEPSSLSLLMPPAAQGAAIRGAMSTASSFLKRMPRRHSSLDRGHTPKSLSSSTCRMLGAGQNVPTILDMLAHFLYIAAGNACFNCNMGSLLEPLHVSTSGQLAVVVAAMMLFAEPWMPREYLTRLCDMREPRIAQHSSRGLLSAMSPPPSNPVRLSVTSHSHGYETRAAERPWLMSFKLTDSADSSRYFKPKPVAATSASAKDSATDAARKSSTDSESTCVNRLPSPPPAHSGPAANGEPARASDSVGRHHRRSLSSHAAGPFATLPRAATPVPDLPPLPTNAAPPPPPPPLPAAEMPTWLPTSAARPQPVPAARSVPRESLPPPPPCPPPLPRQPMPRFQPPESSASPPPPPINNIAIADDLARSSQLNRISAETQMLLSFDSRTRGH
ncbi:Ras guanine nucleotide exchange factor bud5 [Coemansia guatemalensis]|uniref:Ras guanine nucleotide exchange factor bud5 n=1 Tax=Coemansia guatemalensis TaxID=2761395 RepID=A0A9W8LUB6_9FUNG|nr:Ras guanine nucleotide exchange factor bud5 [Coemansia guatemalensis]